jgi:hypothetical protein
MEVDALGAIVAAEPQRHYSADTQQKMQKRHQQLVVSGTNSRSLWCRLPNSQ